MVSYFDIRRSVRLVEVRDVEAVDARRAVDFDVFEAAVVDVAGHAVLHVLVDRRADGDDLPRASRPHR